MVMVRNEALFDFKFPSNRINVIEWTQRKIRILNERPKETIVFQSTDNPPCCSLWNTRAVQLTQRPIALRIHRTQNYFVFFRLCLSLLLARSTIFFGLESRPYSIYIIHICVCVWVCPYSENLFGELMYYISYIGVCGVILFYGPLFQCVFLSSFCLCICFFPVMSALFVRLRLIDRMVTSIRTKYVRKRQARSHSKHRVVVLLY